MYGFTMVTGTAVGARVHRDQSLILEPSLVLVYGCLFGMPGVKLGVKCGASTGLQFLMGGRVELLILDIKAVIYSSTTIVLSIFLW